MEEIADQVRAMVRDVPDFPKPGIMFKDLTPVFEDGATLRVMVDAFAERYRDQKIDRVVGIESRGFLLATPVAVALGCGAALVRKPGKLPRKTRFARYDLEYGQDELHIHEDAVHGGQRVVILDDVLATGGTMEATRNLVRDAGANVVETACILELSFLSGRQRLEPTSFWSLVAY